ncbi:MULTISPECIES: hypothetical protein [Pseudoalteromonas]|uniref:Uncharacterized protein n=1 Tax=Pseudoalteromonas rubra TaxID=43658 RepID=A0A5S3UYX2_9GAMM|nr:MULTISPECIES: hypothetical protein [Pseudoalteromonas]MCG7564219.1 hypothetical protein [Pseudoalteromonas sp. McH1-42]MEC4090231.1 hypothetical protein [Pseudoalteromonas rubra]QPB84959.1 hypothetical protein CWC22_019005 [Pseudoalteromonas rubra]
MLVLIPLIVFIVAAACVSQLRLARLMTARLRGLLAWSSAGILALAKVYAGLSLSAAFAVFIVAGGILHMVSSLDQHSDA